MTTDTRSEVQELLMRRERIKLEMLEKQALQTTQHHRFLAYRESVPLVDRLNLQAQIDALAVDRQSTKIALLTLKERVKAENAHDFRAQLEKKLTALGLGHVIVEAREAALSDLQAAGLLPIYKLDL